MNLEKIVNGAKNYLVDTTGLLLASTPIYASMEVFFSQMSSETSLESRIKVAELSILGLGIAYSKGRDLVRSKLNITEETSELKQSLLDSIYNVAVNISVSIPIYLSSGANLKQALIGAFGASLLGFVSGPINGWSLDTFRDFAGTVKSKRLPKKLQNLSSGAKKALAVGLISTTIGSTALIYEIKNTCFPNLEINYSNTPNL